jgi:antitoxin component YwqK of YwqJK toxin-antitoxin module
MNGLSQFSMKSLVLFVCLLSAAFSFAQSINVKDVKGRKQGPWQETYPDSKALEYKGQFKDDKPVGTFTYWYKNNKVKAIIVHDEVTGRSVATFYHPEGTVFAKGIFRNQLKDSIWDYYGPSGRQSTKETYVKGKLNGMTTIYYVPEVKTDKTLAVAKTMMYVNDTLEGDAIEYFENGKIKSKTKYVKGLKEGVAVINHPAGNPMMKENYVHGAKQGYQYAYDISGKEIGKVFYLGGEPIEGERLQKYLDYCKAKGIDPSK